MMNRFTEKAQNTLNNALRFARELGHTYIGSEHLLLSLAAETDSVSAKMEMIGALTVAKPLSKSVFDSAFRLAAATRMRICLFKKENDRLRSRYEELRLVSQAKCCLIEYRDYTEEEAHKYIEKRAMDERRTKRDIAEDVIETYKID